MSDYKTPINYMTNCCSLNWVKEKSTNVKNLNIRHTM